MDGFVCSIIDRSQGWSLWRGRAECIPIQTGGRAVRALRFFGWGLCERFNVLKRLVVAETEEIEENLVKRVGLATGVCSHACPKAA
jgi:hypothetical protein